jgi:hypothetical protein
MAVGHEEDVLRRPESGGAQDQRREARTSAALALRSARRGASGAGLLCFSMALALAGGRGRRGVGNRLLEVPGRFGLVLWWCDEMDWGKMGAAPLAL